MYICVFLPIFKAALPIVGEDCYLGSQTEFGAFRKNATVMLFTVSAT